ncbi:MAG: sugar phosphate isomerase/epimerase, partial [Campylobacteraceae bacterium]|nr:sugar phosphate isomerase/epimerase [Campylobacteraceae bacterium]
MDGVEAFKKYLDRIGYVHFKDVDPNAEEYEKWPMNAFCELGIGHINFKGIYKVLKNGGYDGVICVELDHRRVCNYKSAMISRRYLHDVLGI